MTEQLNIGIRIFSPEYRNIGHRSFYPNRPFSNNYFLSARTWMCYVTDVNKTFHVDICKFWVKFWFNQQLQRRWQVPL